MGARRLGPGAAVAARCVLLLRFLHAAAGDGEGIHRRQGEEEKRRGKKGVHIYTYHGPIRSPSPFITQPQGRLPIDVSPLAAASNTSTSTTHDDDDEDTAADPHARAVFVWGGVRSRGAAMLTGMLQHAAVYVGAAFSDVRLQQHRQGAAACSSGWWGDRPILYDFLRNATQKLTGRRPSCLRRQPALSRPW